MPGVLRSIIGTTLVLGSLFRANLIGQDIDARQKTTELIRVDTVSPEIRKNRDLLFEAFARSNPDLRTSPPGAPPSVISFSRPLYPELPTEKSDNVVVAHLNTYSTQLSASGKALYTEYHFTLVDMIKAVGILQGASIDVLEAGGAIRTDEGREIRQISHGSGLPLQIGGDYLLFMNRMPEADCYRIFKAWAIVNGRLQPSSYDDIERARRKNSAIAGQILVSTQTEIATRIARQQNFTNTDSQVIRR